MGCEKPVQKIPPEEVSSTSPEEIPLIVPLEDQKGGQVGYGFLWEKEVFVTADHLWEMNPGGLLWNGSEIEVLVRDFEHDVLFFRLPYKPINTNRISGHPPAIGKTLYYEEESGTQKLVVAQKNEILDLGYQTKKRLFSLNGIVQKGTSGTPLFDEEGMIFGMIIGLDEKAQKTFGVRSDVIEELAGEYLE